MLVSNKTYIQGRLQRGERWGRLERGERWVTDCTFESREISGSLEYPRDSMVIFFL